MFRVLFILILFGTVFSIKPPRIFFIQITDNKNHNQTFSINNGLEKSCFNIKLKSILLYTINDENVEVTFFSNNNCKGKKEYKQIGHSLINKPIIAKSVYINKT